MIGIVLMLGLATVTMFISLYPRPKSWAEQSGESLKRWIDGKIK